MKREVLNDWLTALRSGNYDQGEHRLCRNNKFCCLGVFLEVIKEPYETTNYSGSDIRLYDETNDSAVPYKVRMKHKFYSGVGDSLKNEYLSLANLNDYERLSFCEIADIIETNPERYFELED